MKSICISYDFWGTLFKSNPAFKAAQSKLAGEMFNMTPEVFIRQKSYKKIEIDTAVEATGLHFNRLKIYSRILNTSKYGLIESFIEKSNELFLLYPPQRINGLIENVNAVISSNTVLIYGDVLQKIVNKEFGRVHCNFSDKIGYSKPHPEMFRFVGLKADQPMFHVGDNPRTDGACEKVGIKFIPVEEYSKFNEHLKYL